MSAGTTPDSSFNFLVSPHSYERQIENESLDDPLSLFPSSHILDGVNPMHISSTIQNSQASTQIHSNINGMYQHHKQNSDEIHRSNNRPVDDLYSITPRITESQEKSDRGAPNKVDLIHMILESISSVPFAIEKINANPHLLAALEQEIGRDNTLLQCNSANFPCHQWRRDRADQVDFTNRSLQLNGINESIDGERDDDSSGFGSDYEQDLAEAVQKLVMSHGVVSKMERNLSSPIQIDNAEMMSERTSPHSSVCYGASPGTNSQDGEPVSALWPRQADEFAFTQEEQDDMSEVGAQDEVYSETVGSICETSSFQERDDEDQDFGEMDKVFEMDDDDEAEYKSSCLLPFEQNSVVPTLNSSLDHRIQHDRKDDQHDEGDVIRARGDEADIEEGADDDEEQEYDIFQLRIIREKHRTGFEPSEDWRPRKGGMLGCRYKVHMEIGEAVFSRTYKCLDMETDQFVCLKIIKNSKEYFDQGVDEIRILQCIAEHGDVDEKHLVRLMDYFYFREHLIIVTELLRDNLYEFSRLLKERGHANYFSTPRLKKVAKEVLEALTFLHSLDLVHCDLKPENILISDYNECRIKVIDFGSACFVTDELTSYVQSRSYRAPEVILGLPYDQKIDVWSLGCVLAELYTGEVLFTNDSEQSLLERIIGTIGPIPEDLLQESNDLVFQFKENSSFEIDVEGNGVLATKSSSISSLEDVIQTDDAHFIDFLRSLLRIHPQRRLSAHDALNHVWLKY